ncbi:unnamed protein product [Ceratitis capitata]|uniref:(Mediterranean fruit fly) hypothetical protein n=1 Tax=Ceratitis capitata TaxID=7213 RepID=A0A811U6L8_CERCA|nr:unnamed protein product [Ceratitis capitata]
MRAFIVLCLFAVACADKLGYNYRPVGHRIPVFHLHQVVVVVVLVDLLANALRRITRCFHQGPEGNGLENAAINLARHAAEQRTAVYVLQKQADLGDLANKLQAQHDIQSHKPRRAFRQVSHTRRCG